MTTLRIDGERRVPWRSVPHLVSERSRLGSRVAVADDTGEATFSALDQAMGRVGRAVAGMGIGPGDRVALWAPNSIRWIEIALGVLANGAIVVPLSTRLRGNEVAHALRASGASLLFSVAEHLGTSFLDLLAGAGSDLDDVPKVAMHDRTGPQRAPAGMMPWAEFMARGDDVTPLDLSARSENLSQQDPAFVVFTSGTTGRPKGAILHHGALLYSAVQMQDGFDLREDDRLFVVLPLFHVFGLAMLFSSVTTGARFSTTAAAFSPDVLVASLERERVTVVPGPPTIFDALLDSKRRASADLSALRLAFVASTGVPGSLVRRLRSAGLFEHIVSGYGSTEGLIVSLSRLDEDLTTTAEWSGQVLREAQVRVVGLGQEALPPGTAGELLVRTPSTTSGYIGDPAASATAIDGDGWLHTGDVGIVDERGYVRITDRLKDMFIVGGFNAYPAEIERTLEEHPAVLQAAVIGIPDPRLGEVGAAFLVIAEGCSLGEADLIAWSRAHMSNYKVPREVHFVRSMPMTVSMKVAKSELRLLRNAAK